MFDKFVKLGDFVEQTLKRERNIMFEKKGLIYCPNGEHEWEKDTFMTPHAMLIEPGIIRIWGGVRDKDGVSRIKYIDVQESNPKNILKISNKVSLDIGNPG